MSYRIGRGETGVLTFEPYKSLLLPLWRFKTVPIARRSSAALYAKFTDYAAAGDFIGMDMARKFLQMGMTRAQRYANHAGGRKYDKKTGVELEKSGGHEGKGEKEEASKVFKGVWERAKMDEEYVRRKEEFLEEQKEWDREEKRMAKVEGRVWEKSDATKSGRMKGIDREKKLKKEKVKEEEKVKKVKVGEVRDVQMGEESEGVDGKKEVEVKKEVKVKKEAED